jgi:hypothetical protein
MDGRRRSGLLRSDIFLQFRREADGFPTNYGRVYRSAFMARGPSGGALNRERMGGPRTVRSGTGIGRFLWGSERRNLPPPAGA